MADEHQFIEQGLRRTQIDEFFAQELSRAGYGGMDLAQTPMGTQIVLKAEKPGMVIGKGGKNIRKLTTQIEKKFDLDDPQIDVQEVDEPDLNAQIVADRLANALERGWYFRKAGHTTIDRIMDSGALGAEIVLSGKVTGARSRVEKFNRGYIKHNGEPADTIVDRGDGTAVMKLGTIGVQVRIIPPNAKLPDDFHIQEDADIEQFVEEAEEGVDDLLAEADEALDDEVQADAEDVDEPAEPATDVAEEEVVDEDVEIEEGEAATSPPDSEEPVEAELDELEEEIGDLDEDTEAEAEDLMDEMDAAEAEAEEADADADEASEAETADEADDADDEEVEE
jgi:small subunit ribosomal protein S3